MILTEIAARAKKLQEELEEIKAHNRSYYTARTHSMKERNEHTKLQGRVTEIRDELAKLLGKK